VPSQFVIRSTALIHPILQSANLHLISLHLISLHLINLHRLNLHRLNPGHTLR